MLYMQELNNTEQKLNLVFDIGYNLGHFSKIILETNAECQIVGIEANPEICEQNILRENSNVVLINAAASDSDDKFLNFYVCDGGVCEHVLSTASPQWMTGRFLGKGNWRQPIQIQTITLNKLVDAYGIPDLIKIDVEGWEEPVLRGLTKFVPTRIMFEWTEEFFPNTVSCVNYLKSLGYTKFGYVDCTKTTKTEKEQLFGIEYNDWDKLDIHKNLLPSRKWNWGMIYCK